jgi:hypothetical protein
MSLLGENFAVAAQLAEVAAVKVQAVLLCLEDNSQERIRLRNPVVGGNSVSYDWVSPPGAALAGCCELRDVRVSDDKLIA